MRQIKVKIAAPKTPLIERTVAILKREIKEKSSAKVAETGRANAHLVLDVQPGIGTEGFRIESGTGKQVRIIGNDERGLLYGLGKFLRDSRRDESGFTPGAWRGTSVPEMPLRGIYFATHFYNVYHIAPVETIQRYIEELALWGCNALAVWYDMHHYNGIDDHMGREMIERLRRYLITASEVGMGATLCMIANEAYADSPVEMRAKGYGNFGCEVCPSKPGAVELMLQWREEMLREFDGLDIKYYWVWPHDQGGCDCEKCTPWGGNGYLHIGEPVMRLTRKHFPQAKGILSTWWFDECPNVRGEWEGLTKAFSKPQDWVEIILADSSYEFPAYPLTHGVPGGLPLINFPEISMHGMYPWGGWGANPLPARFQHIWDSTQGKLSGGYPYSEGIYEDMNKALALQYYWDPKSKVIDGVREYAASEFTPDAVDELQRAAELMEQNHDRKWVKDEARGVRVAVMKDPDAARECWELVKRALAKMSPQAKAAWRWRVFYLRAAIDAELAQSDGTANEQVDRYLKELTEIYCMRTQGRHSPIRKSIGWSEADEEARGADE